MILTFLGTSAANAFPEAFCSCERCQQARLLGGANLRKRSSLLVNDDLLIDLGPDIHSAAQMHALDLSAVQFCLQTHAHADHLDLSHLNSRSPEYGTLAPRLHFYASAETLDAAAQTFERDLANFPLLAPESQQRLNLELHAIQPFVPFELGSYTVIAFPANHDPGRGALLYAVSAGGSSLFYATDTGELYEETWQAFHRFDLCFDGIVLDHTYGPAQQGGGHLSAHQVAAHAVRFRQQGLLKPAGRVFATHIAHEGNPVNPELQEFAAAHGYEVAHDGLRLLL